MYIIYQLLSRQWNIYLDFSGGPGQYPHLAPTYAAVNALCILATEEAYEVINRSVRPSKCLDLC